jgi:putative transposase
MKDTFKKVRNSRMNLNEVYFWTSTIKDWKKLLGLDKYKTTIIDTWKSQVDKKQIIVYGFVIMPNHIHALWELKNMNGKEMPHASFNKATAHEIIKDLKNHHTKVLPYFKVNDHERSYRVWQRDPLAILMDSKSKFEQKLNYIHFNPLQERWNLAVRPENYKWSSASFYETGVDPFGFLTHYTDYYD